jgi:hypothetical protein
MWYILAIPPSALVGGVKNNSVEKIYTLAGGPINLEALGVRLSSL